MKPCSKCASSIVNEWDLCEAHHAKWIEWLQKRNEGVSS
jgi:hypothetical protein